MNDRIGSEAVKAEHPAPGRADGAADRQEARSAGHLVERATNAAGMRHSAFDTDSSARLGRD